ncbi:MAG TPA: hypothetical protein VF656_17520 [Pyrinomonadaceae bacterium]|jgi:hypothetical protein
MNKINNPAGRLHTLLQEAKKKEGNNNGYHLWATVFDISQNPDEPMPDEVLVEVIHRVVQMIDLISDAERTLKTIPDIDTTLYLEPYSRIRKVLRIDNLPLGNYREHLKQITNGDMALLAIGAVEISKHQDEPIIEEQVLDKFLEEIDALFKEVRTSSINDKLKRFILEQLELIRRAVHEYQIGGIERLRKALAMSLGELILHKDLIEESKDQEEVRKYGNIVNHLFSVVSFAADMTQVIEGVGKYLPYLLLTIGKS